MNTYESKEDYLERILILYKTQDKVISLDLAKSFNYSKASISKAMKKLKEEEYIIIDDSGIIKLTDKGHKIANKMLERHNVLTEYFIQLGVSKKIAESDACKIEHDLSDETYNAILKHIKK